MVLIYGFVITYKKNLITENTQISPATAAPPSCNNVAASGWLQPQARRLCNRHSPWSGSNTLLGTVGWRRTEIHLQPFFSLYKAKSQVLLRKPLPDGWTSSEDSITSKRMPPELSRRLCSLEPWSSRLSLQIFLPAYVLKPFCFLQDHVPQIVLVFKHPARNNRS